MEAHGRRQTKEGDMFPIFRFALEDVVYPRTKVINFVAPSVDSLPHPLGHDDTRRIA
jgi:hypothetical protein